LPSIRSESDGSTNRNHATHQKNPERLAGQAPGYRSDQVVQRPRVRRPGTLLTIIGFLSCIKSTGQLNHIRYRNRNFFLLEAIASALVLRVVGIGAKQ
jgi:hypothetical protein